MTITDTRPTVQATPDRWWTCPTWCGGGEDCFGGEVFTYPTGEIITNRMHTGTLVEVITDGHDGSAPQIIRVLAERCDSPDTGPGEVRRVLHVGLADRPEQVHPDHAADLLRGTSREQRDNLAAHLIAGVWNQQSAYLTDEAVAALVAALTAQT